MRRDMELWWPWYERRRGNARGTEPRLDPARLTTELRETMKQLASFAPAWRAAMSYPIGARLARLTQPTCLMAAPQDVFARCLPLAHGARPDASVAEVQDTAKSRAQTILGSISQWN